MAQTEALVAEDVRTLNLISFFRAIYFWVMFISVTLFSYFAIVLFKIFNFFIRKDDPSLFPHKMANLWAKNVFRFMPGWKVDIIGRENLPTQAMPFVIVSNHQSAADIWLMYYLNIQFRWLAKDSLFKIPVIGPCMKAAGYVPVKRGEKTSHKLAFEKSRMWIRQGIPMFFFPEGTRSKDGKLLSFKPGAFKLALQENCPILPVVIQGAYKLFPKGSFMPGKAEGISVEILPLIQPDFANSEEFAQKTKEVIASKLVL